jgi:hypothetical protein
VEGEVNRQPVTFLVDTGASHVSVSQALATQAGRSSPRGSQPPRLWPSPGWCRCLRSWPQGRSCPCPQP